MYGFVLVCKASLKILYDNYQWEKRYSLADNTQTREKHNVSQYWEISKLLEMMPLMLYLQITVCWCLLCFGSEWCCLPWALFFPTSSLCVSSCGTRWHHPEPDSCTHQNQQSVPLSLCSHSRTTRQLPWFCSGDIWKCIDFEDNLSKYIVIFLPENEVDRLHHHLLNFLTATVGHFALVIKTYSVKKNNYWWCKRFVVKAETHKIWTFSKNSILTSFHTISSQQKSQFRHWKKSITARI